MVDAATRNPQQTDRFAFLLRSFLFGLFTYAVLAGLYRLAGNRFDVFSLDAQVPFSEKSDEILWSIPLALLFAAAWVAARTYGWLHALLRHLKISDYSGSDDIWDYAFSNFGGVVYVRDFKERVIYQGYALGFSDRRDLRELLLTHVRVASFAGEEGYSLPALYLARSPNQMTVEFGQQEDGDGEKTDDTRSGHPDRGAEGADQPAPERQGGSGTHPAGEGGDKDSAAAQVAGQEIASPAAPPPQSGGERPEASQQAGTRPSP